eukprot:CAMPEP_0183745510 /NCGR_PEP_ID=MMETSP0737-20130205/66281_1 /TAXON_ID=385413 /ORGANISM="Thalassiosira miniscula, Strain CCMP1093" /LENGTH=223 /DNA_ID=CAMNT_0025981185 /DNA_START=564 /DNA_END=1235 /DNA_ORIENTATION=-
MFSFLLTGLIEGDSLLAETERYHQQAEEDHHVALNLDQYVRRSKRNSLFDPCSNALFDPVLEEYILPHQLLMHLKAMEESEEKVALREDLLKRRKNGSLSCPYSGAMFDPVLHEYTLPGTTMLELKALKEDIHKKRQLFNEMQTRREDNLENFGVFCDPLVRTYWMNAILFNNPPEDATTKEVKEKMKSSDGIASTYRKLNRGDDLMKASNEYHKRMALPTTQ